MKQYANAFAILYGSVCAGLAFVSAWKMEPVHSIALTIGAVGCALASFLSAKRLA